MIVKSILDTDLYKFTTSYACMKLYYLFLLVMFFLMGCTNSSNISGPDVIGTSKIYGDVYRYTIDEHG